MITGSAPSASARRFGVHRRGQRLTGDQIAVGLDRVDPLVAGGHRQLDPVGHVEVGVASSLLDEPHEVASSSFDLEFVGHLDVEGDHPGVSAETGAGLVAGRDQLERVLPGFEERRRRR